MPTALMTIDVEDWFHPATFSHLYQRPDWDGLESRVVASTQFLLRALGEKGMVGTFFVLGWVAERHPELVRSIQRGGHEVASHGYGHEIVYKLTPEAFAQDVRKSLDVLQQITGEAVLGYRAPNFSITDWAVDILQEHGLRYDSSYFPTVGHDRYGKLECYPAKNVPVYEIKDGFYEVPLTSLQAGGKLIPWSGGNYFRVMPYPLFRWGMRRILQQRGVFNFYLHPWEVDPGQPREKRLSPIQSLRAYNNLSRIRGRYESLTADFQFTSIKDWLAEQAPITLD